MVFPCLEAEPEPESEPEPEEEAVTPVVAKPPKTPKTAAKRGM